MTKWLEKQWLKKLKNQQNFLLVSIHVANDADDLMLFTKNLNYAVFVFVNLLIKDKSLALKKQAGKK